MIGDSINIAARLQAKAATGEILVTAEAYQPISGLPACGAR
jgi:class 3 adenylate cyclase